MRKGWTHKKLGDICAFIGGGTPSKSVSKYYSGNIPWATVRDMGIFKLNSTELKITQEAVDNSATNVLPKGMIIISTHVGLGKVCELMQDTAINQDLKGADLDAAVIDKYYFCYWYKSKSNYILSNATGATVKGVTLKFLQGLDIALPPIDIQHKIVSELDLLCHILEKKHQQLKEYDALTESIFYDMFGDPVENPRGWKMKPFCNFASSELGKMLDKNKNTGRLHPYLCTINVLWNEIDLSCLKEMRIEDEELERYSVKKGDLLICEGGDTGRCAIWNKEETVFYQNSLHRVRFDSEKMLPITCLYILHFYKEKGVIASYSKGQTIQHLVKKVLLSIPLPEIPLPLQRQFADKIESIERQKHLLKESIKETETLFQSRMDYWFNS